MSRTSRLENALNIDGGDDANEVHDNIGDWEVKITDDMRELDQIAKLALKAYESMMNSMFLINPEGRIKYLEVAQRYLTESKDAIHKRDVLMEKRLDREDKKKANANKGQTPTSNPNGEGGTSRAELEKMVAERRKMQ